jgi:hypothetical protein
MCENNIPYVDMNTTVFPSQFILDFSSASRSGKLGFAKH